MHLNQNFNHFTFVAIMSISFSVNFILNLEMSCLLPLVGWEEQVIFTVCYYWAVCNVFILFGVNCLEAS